LVLSDIWLATLHCGSLATMARYYLWFSLSGGSLYYVVLFQFWLAFYCGSLIRVARSYCWFSLRVGSLNYLVLSTFWLAKYYGSLIFLATIV